MSTRKGSRSSKKHRLAQTMFACAASALLMQGVALPDALAVPPRLILDPFDTSVVRGGPNELLVVTGDRLDVDAVQNGASVPPTVKYQRVSDTTQLNPPALAPGAPPTAESGYAEVVNSSSARMTVRLPPVLAEGEIYALWIHNGQNDTYSLFINDPRPLWFSPSFMVASGSAGTPLSPSGGPGTLKVIGRNLQPRRGHVTKVKLQKLGTSTSFVYTAADQPSTLGEYVAEVALTDALPVGDYDVFVSRDSGAHYVKWRPQIVKKTGTYAGGTWTPLAQTGAFQIRPAPAVPVVNAAANEPWEYNLKDQIPGCSPDDDTDDTWCIARAIRVVHEHPGKGVVKLSAGTQGWKIKKLYAAANTSAEGYYKNVPLPAAQADCTPSHMLGDYPHKWYCLASQTPFLPMSNTTPAWLASVATTWVSREEGIALLEGVSLVGENGAKIVREADFRPGFTTPIFTVYKSSEVRNIVFESSLDVPFRYAGASCDPAAPTAAACDVQEVDDSAAIALGCAGTVMSTFDPQQQPPLRTEVCTSEVRDVVIANNTFLGGATGILATGKPVKELFLRDNTFAARSLSVNLAGSRKYAASSFKVQDSIVSGNTFYPGSYFHSEALPTESNGLGDIAFNVHGAERLDLSNNTADGRVLDHDHTSTVDANGQPNGKKRGFRAAFFFGTQSNLEQVLASRNTGYCTGDKIGDGEFISVDNNGNNFAYWNQFHVALGQKACTSNSQCAGAGVCGSQGECECTQASDCGGAPNVCSGGVCYARSYHVTPQPVLGVYNDDADPWQPYVVLPKGIVDKPWPQYSDSIGDEAARRDFFAHGHYLAVTSGPGAGQVRRIWNIGPGYGGNSEVIYLDRTFEVPPVVNQSHVMVLSGSWHFYQVANTSDQSQCQTAPGHPNFEGKLNQGSMGFYASAFHSVVDGNLLTSSGGVQAAQQGAAAMLQYFDEYRNNTIDGEMDYGSSCSRGGVNVPYAGIHPASSRVYAFSPPSPAYVPPITGLGLTIAGNDIHEADGWRGGAISFALTGPFDGHSYNFSPLVYGNTVQGLAGGELSHECTNQITGDDDKSEDIPLLMDRHTTGVSISPLHDLEPNQTWMVDGALLANRYLYSAAPEKPYERVDAVSTTSFVSETSEGASAVRVAAGTPSRTPAGTVSFAPEHLSPGDPRGVEIDVQLSASTDAACDGASGSTGPVDLSGLELWLVTPSQSSVLLANGFASAPANEQDVTITFDDTLSWGVTAGSALQSRGYRSAAMGLQGLTATEGDWTLEVKNPTQAHLCIKSFTVLFRALPY